MNTLFINPPGKISFVSPPLGLLYVAASLKEDGHKVFVIDYNLEKLERRRLSDFIKEKQIEIVGISIVTPKVYDAIELANCIKKQFPDITIIAGGPHATLMPEELLLKCPAINFVIQGEGEIRMEGLIKNIKNKEEIKKLDGIAFWENGQLINNPPKEYLENLNTIPLPARDLIDILKYSNHLKTSISPATTMMTSRGCPFQCIYCSKPVTGSKLRSLSPENVIKEIESLQKEYGIREIVFYDDSFTLDRERTMKICDLIIQNGIKLAWQCETRVNLVDKELLEKMKQAGCYLIAYGIESGSDRVLKILKKGITVEQVKKAVETTKKAGIRIIGYFMLGIPGETEEEIKQTIKFAKELDIDFAQFAIATAYPGTELYEIAKAQNKITSDWSKSIYALGGKPLVGLSDVSIDKLYGYMKKAYRSFYFRPRYIWDRLTSIKSVSDLLSNLKGLKTLIKI